MKLKFSIKNLRERLAKGLVDKGVLGTESQSFGLFEMATHPLKDASVKEEVCFRVQVRPHVNISVIERIFQPAIDALQW